MVGRAYRRVTVIRQTTGRRIITFGQIACEDAVGELGDGAHTRQDLIPIFLGAEAFPLRHPVASVSQPVRTNTKTGRCLTGILIPRLCQTHGIDVI